MLRGIMILLVWARVALLTTLSGDLKSRRVNSEATSVGIYRMLLLLAK